MKMTMDKADILFSQWIRLRDRECVRCFSPVRFNEKGKPVSHTNSHYFGRTKQSVRFDPDNCDTLCHGCHRIWEVEDREAYREFKINQLGEEGFAKLIISSRLYHKKDYLAERLYWRQRLKEDFNNGRIKKTDSSAATGPRYLRESENGTGNQELYGSATQAAGGFEQDSE